MKQINKFILQVHNTSGSFLSLIFVIWFFSGIVLIFDRFPHASREERFLQLPEFTAQHFENLQAPSNNFKGDVVLEICDGKPVYRVLTGRKAQHLFDAGTLKSITSFSEKYAKDLCESFNRHSVKEIKLMNEVDQWIPYNYYKPLLPFYKCYMNDPSHTVLYISDKSGEIVQQTTRKERWFARLGAIPHWVYFKQLRLMLGTWRIVIIILSSLGILMSVTGIYVGIARLKKRKQNGITPYKKFWYKWHHLTGFFFGLFVFSFVLSGLISVTSVPDWMVGIKSSEKQKIKWEEKLNLRLQKNTSPQEIFTALNQKKGIRKIEWKNVFGEPQYRIYYDNYQVPKVYTLQDDEIRAFNSFSLEEIEMQAKSIFGELTYNAKMQPAYDYYYAASAMFYLPLPACKIELNDAAKTWLFINPANGDEVRRLNKNSRVRRWLYRFLHTLDIPFFKKAEGLRKTILVLLSLIGLVVSISGFILSLKWFKRSCRRRKKLPIKNNLI